jgi:hypothetical protein
MADWTNSSGLFPRPIRSVWGAPQIRYFQESSGVSSAQCAVGHVVVLDTVVTTGGMRVRRDPSTAGNGANLQHLGGSLLGIAVTGSTADSTGGTRGLLDDSSQAQNRLGDRTIGVAIADGLTEYLGYFKSGGAGTTPQALSSIIGQDRPLIFDSTLGTYFVASTNSTAALVTVRITDFPPDVRGDSGGVPCYFKFLSSNVHVSVRLTGPTV